MKTPILLVVFSRLRSVVEPDIEELLPREWTGEETTWWNKPRGGRRRSGWRCLPHRRQDHRRPLRVGAPPTEVAPSQARIRGTSTAPRPMPHGTSQGTSSLRGSRADTPCRCPTRWRVRAPFPLCRHRRHGDGGGGSDREGGPRGDGPHAPRHPHASLAQSSDLPADGELWVFRPPAGG